MTYAIMLRNFQGSVHIAISAFLRLPSDHKHILLSTKLSIMLLRGCSCSTLWPCKYYFQQKYILIFIKLNWRSIALFDVVLFIIIFNNHLIGKNWQLIGKRLNKVFREVVFANILYTLFCNLGCVQNFFMKEAPVIMLKWIQKRMWKSCPCLFLNVCDFYLQNGNEHHLRQKVVCYKREVLVVNDLNTFTLRVYDIPPYQNFFCIIRILSSINKM